MIDDVFGLTSIKFLNKYWKFLNSKFGSEGDCPTGSVTSRPKSIFAIGLDQFKNSFSNLSKIFLSNTEKISSILEYSSVINNLNGDCCVVSVSILFK